MDDVVGRSPLLGSLEVQLLMRETYEDLFRIFNHGEASYQRPLALVAMHEAENVTTHGPLYNTIRRYRRAGIKDAFKLSLTEFLTLPREYTALLFSIMEEEAQANIPKIKQGMDTLRGKGS